MDAMAATARGPAPGAPWRPAACRRLQLTVRDRGPGIAAADLPKVFDSFFSTKRGGMGLGLAIARTHGPSARRHTSGPRMAPMPARCSTSNLPARSGVGTCDASEGRAMTAAPLIHVVDDDESLRTALLRLLGAAGYRGARLCLGRRVPAATAARPARLLAARPAHARARRAWICRRRCARHGSRCRWSSSPAMPTCHQRARDEGRRGGLSGKAGRAQAAAGRSNRALRADASARVSHGADTEPARAIRPAHAARARGVRLRGRRAS